MSRKLKQPNGLADNAESHWGPGRPQLIRFGGQKTRRPEMVIDSRTAATIRSSARSVGEWAEDLSYQMEVTPKVIAEISLILSRKVQVTAIPPIFIPCDPLGSSCKTDAEVQGNRAVAWEEQSSCALQVLMICPHLQEQVKIWLSWQYNGQTVEAVLDAAAKELVSRDVKVPYELYGVMALDWAERRVGRLTKPS